MRNFAWSLAAVCALALGCNKPVETIPAVTPEPAPSSGTTLDEAHDHDHAEGDHDHATETPAADPVIELDDAAPAEEPSAANSSPEKIRFVADKRISVPSMMCPYACWPKVKETLAAQPGVEDVQLAEQPAGTAEGEIKERIVELKLNDSFNADAAIAALQKANYEAEFVTN